MEYPTNIYVPVKKNVGMRSKLWLWKLKKRMKVAKQWMIVMWGVPMSVVLLPFSCCARNPAAGVMMDGVAPVPDEGLDMVMENVGVGVYGLAAVVSGGCFCCGCCGTMLPRDA